ncbi:tetratricopeptide repeat protein [Leptothermofonsia sichuanensis E412]|uniref:tetratricopeptide repeat protein n=1 Tax=Leptothermofonsia sichuanensis TaxID=2917832 RepID=UPI001CA79D1B|nr:tetratricopeptide repeat protein [Leptothermofonsia sichuanensis]QZZ21194.1 tetratricopeptide repeat protein [Leptothermofonsia sichuanensis E412]
MIAPSDNLQLALQHQREGRTCEAEQVYRQILEHQPDSVDALNLLGALVYQQGRFQEAVACFEQVLILQPDNPDSYNSMGVVLKGQGRAEEAVSYYRQALELRPEHPEVHNNLGNALRQVGGLEEAIAAYEQALALRPNYPEAHNNLGVALKDQGRLEDALSHLQTAIALKPNYPEAYQGLGSALQRLGRLEEAAQAFQQALALKPDYPEACNSLGNLLQQQGRFEEAVVQHQQAITLRPNYPEAHHSLANAFQQQGRLEEAIAQYEQALALRPDYPEACSNLGNAFQEQGKVDQAIAQYRRALELRPDFAEAHSNLGAALKEQRKIEEAIAHFQEAIALRPDYPEVHNNLGNLYQEQGRVAEAIASYRTALEIKPDFAEIHSNLGNILQQEGQFEEAFQHFHRAIELQPNYAGAYNNLGIALRNTGQVQAAFEAYEKAIAADPNFVEAHWNKALNHLLIGEFQPGFAGYEWRFRWSRFQQQSPPRPYPQPRWDGSPLEGKTIFLYAEQGMGDTIQFIRYVPLVARQGGQVIVECHPPLVDLLRTVAGITQIIPYGSPVPPFDIHASLMSLPHILGTTLDTIPAHVPYINAPDQDPAILPQSLFSRSSSPCLKIGIVWSGNPENPYNRARTVSLKYLLPLAELPGIQLYSLQKEPSTEDIQCLQRHPEIQDLRGLLTSFVTTASIIRQLDLILSVDTAVTHLAGALGKPVWLLLPFAPDWRWMLEREDSPWYPTMRLFRQPSFGAWESVLVRVREELEKEVGDGRRQGTGYRLPGVKVTEGQSGGEGLPHASLGAFSALVDTISAALNPHPPLPDTPYVPPAPRPPLPEDLKTAIQHQQAGRLREAEQVCHQILQQQEHPEVWHLLGLIAHRERKYEAAIAHYRKVLAADPNHQDVCNNLAVALHEQGRLEEAIAYYQQALRLKPNYADAHNNYANALRAKGQVEEAIHHYRMAIAYNPQYADAYNNLGLAFYAQEAFAQAADCYRQAVALRPDFAQAHNHLGNALKELGDFTQAAEHYQQAIALKPDYAKAYNNWGNIFRDQGDLQTAIQYYDQAIAIEADFAEAHWNKALTLLIGGDFQAGFAEYEWRWKVNLPSFHPMRPLPAPLWDGSPLNGKTIFLHAEQGMGDIIQFVRYSSLVAERGGRILLECHPPLVELLKGIPHIQQVIPYGSPPPAFDVHAPLLSLAHILGTTLETVPAPIPYLRVPARADLPLLPAASPPAPCLKIGIVWSGNPENPYNRTRAIPLELLLSLAEIPNVHLFSLQKEVSPADQELLAAHPEVWDLRAQLTDFVHTAALVNQLDLVISVDTAVTHLAGAMGQRVWLLLPYAPDWRWMLERQDSPWYPTMQVFRQAVPGDWAGVIAQVRQALGEKPATRKAVSTAVSSLVEGYQQPGVGLSFQGTGFGEPEPNPATQHKQAKHPQKARKKSPTPTIPTGSPGSQPPKSETVLPSQGLETVLQYYNDGNLAEAERVCRQILAVQPGQVETRHLLAVILCRSGQLESAIAQFRQVLQQEPNFADAWCNLGSALREQGNPEAAIAHYRRAITLNPDHADAQYNLGTVLQEQDQLEEALIHCQRAVALKPDFADAYYSLGFVQRRLAHLEAAIASYRRAVQLAPWYPEAHKNLGHALLLQGDLKNGFAEYEWRWRQKNWAPRPFSQPLWDGSSLEGKTILLHAEQGMGDTIQFIRYAPLVKARGGNVLVECQPLLRRLLETAPGIDHLIVQGSPLPPFDTHAPLLSLPHILGTTLDTIPASIPYLASPPFPPTSHFSLLTPPSLPLPLKIGIVWAGNPDHKNNRYRSCKLEHFQSLINLPGVHFYSLQKGDGAAELQANPNLPIEDMSGRLEDFADTAAAIAQFDLIISVDTAVAHLAGALGKPVWLLLSYSPDWRWMLERQDSPWYPTMRLFRQNQPGDWQSVFEQVEVALRQKVGTAKPGIKGTEQPLDLRDGEKGRRGSAGRHPRTEVNICWNLDLVSDQGIYGVYLALALLKNPQLRPVLTASIDESLPSLYQALLRPLLAPPEAQSVPGKQWIVSSLGESVVLPQAPGQLKDACHIGLAGSVSSLTPDAIARARHCSRLLTASTWMTERFRSWGLNPIQIAMQGVDPTLVYPGATANLFGDRFVIFSGGELSYSRGADIVISAFKAFYSRHPEALLVTAWHSVGSASLKALELSGNVPDLPAGAQTGQLRVREWLLANGLPSDSFLTLGAVPYPQLGQVLREADAALFPSRCEVGINLNAIASLACGIPTLLSANTGNLDLIRHNLGYPLQSQRPVKATDLPVNVEGWGESDVEEVVETLERIYTNHREASHRGTAAADFIKDWTWEKQILSFMAAVANSY